MFEEYLRRWNLLPDGNAIGTHSSDLLPVRFEGRAAMLKLARGEEERRGNRLMVLWAGVASARVYAHDDAALLMERVEGDFSLERMVQDGQDDEATGILCRIAQTLHEARPLETGFPTLKRWFRSLARTAPSDSRLSQSWEVAQHLLNDPRDVRVLHGDIHHANVLHDKERGWLAIDPKGIVGERSFDYANIFSNPTLEHAMTPGRLARQSHVVSQAAGLERSRLLQWIVAYAGLSAAWFLEDDDHLNADKQLEIARLALTEL